MLHLALALTLSHLQVSATEAASTKTEDAAQRQASVERLLTPELWVEGQEFTLAERMQRLNVPGVSIAVIHEGRIDWAAGYGLRDASGTDPVTPQTLFQAASISKPVSALAAMRLAQAGKLSLDAPINSLLTSWTLHAGNFDGEVTPRHLLSHTGGLGVHGFPGYPTYDPFPSAVEVLDGAGHTNTEAVRRVDPLGRQQRYSGGGSTIMQVALQDLSGTDFTSLMAEQVLEPLGMSRSTYAQPLPVEQWADHSLGHSWGGHPLPGGFHVYPEQYPAGLWTTPTDLAHFALAIQASFQGEEEAILEQAWAQEMLTPVLENSALGFFIEHHGDELWFGHGGSNEGFKCLMRASQVGGRGVVIMTNGDQGYTLVEEVLRAVVRVYDWPGVVESPLAGPKLEPAALEAYVGRYAAGPDELSVVRMEGEHLVLHNPIEGTFDLAPVGEHEFLLLGRPTRLTFENVTAEGAASFTWTANSGPHAERLGEHPRWPLDDLLEGELDAAFTFYRDVFASDPEDPMVARDRLHDLAVALFNDGPAAAGLGLAELVAELYPADAGIWDTLGQLYFAQGEEEAARTAYQHCLERLADDASLTSADRIWLGANAESKLRGLGG